MVVQGKGKFEELMVCSREIAASTAQLVAASKVSREFTALILTRKEVFMLEFYTTQSSSD